MASISGEEFRSSLVWRSSFETTGRWDIPIVRKQGFPKDIDLISYSDIRTNDRAENTSKGVHFFIDDPRFESIYSHPEDSLARLSQYRFVLTPDYSLYMEMNAWMQLYNIGRSRWCGAYWQSKGLHVIPTVSWGLPGTYEFCFDGIERNAPVAVSTLGCRDNRHGFMRGYEKMLDVLDPSQVLCFGKPFDEMNNVTTVVDYIASRKTVR